MAGGCKSQPRLLEIAILIGALLPMHHTLFHGGGNGIHDLRRHHLRAGSGPGHGRHPFRSLLSPADDHHFPAFQVDDERMHGHGALPGSQAPVV